MSQYLSVEIDYEEKMCL